jgi:peptide/nickel transport system permease protein
MIPSKNKILFNRIASSIVVLFLLVTFVFVLLRVSPGNPADKYLSPKLSPLLLEKVKRSMNSEENLLSQYFSFVGNFIKGDLGVSYKYHEPVIDVIAQTIPFTLGFSAFVFFLQLTAGFFTAFIALNYCSERVKNLITKLNFVVFSTPSFVSGLLLIFIFSVKLGWFPASGEKSINSDEMNFFERLFDYASHLILPAICLALTGIPVYYKYFKDGFEENYKKLFVQYLRSAGVSEKRIFFRHVVPNSISPVISYAGVDLGLLLSSVVITEYIFGLHGLGSLTVNAILERDYPLVAGCALSAGVIMILTNFTADLIKGKIDRRQVEGGLN